MTPSTTNAAAREVEMKTYFVTVPFRAEQYFIVQANSAAEAMRKADDLHIDAEALDFKPTHTYKANSAVIDGAQP